MRILLTHGYEIGNVSHEYVSDFTIKNFLKNLLIDLF